MRCNQPSEEDIAGAECVSSMVGGLPIAIAHMAGYMFTSKTKLKELQQRLGTEEAYHIWLKPKTWTTPLYEQTLDRVWQIALEELPAAAIELLYAISMLNPDTIPEKMFDGWAFPDSDHRTMSVNSLYQSLNS